MLRPFLLFVLLIAGTVYLTDYLGSPDFQSYADTKKYPWTCTLNNRFGDFKYMMSDYPEAYDYYEPVMTRCPETGMAEDALFRMASCQEKSGKPNDAIRLYEQFLEMFPNSEKYELAKRASSRLRLNR